MKANKKLSIYYFILLLLVCTALLGCRKRQNQSELTVLAAMSLRDALSEIGAEWTKKHDVKVIFNFAASTTLQRQIEKGAYADIFISANPEQVNALEKQNLLETDTRVDLLGNRLVLVSHKKDDLSIKKIERLTDNTISRIAIGQPVIVPAGTYAKEALVRYGIWEKVIPKLVFGTDVRGVLAYVSAGNVDVAIVYQTDVQLRPDVRMLTALPAETHTPIVYPAVALKNSHQKQDSRKFLMFLKTDSTNDIFEKYGFTVLSAGGPIPSW